MSLNLDLTRYTLAQRYASLRSRYALSRVIVRTRYRADPRRVIDWAAHERLNALRDAAWDARRALYSAAKES